MSCQEQKSAAVANAPIDMSKYPASIKSVFDAHGGLNKWNTMKSLSYDIIKDGTTEKQTLALQDRRELIEGPNFTIGYDGEKTWVDADTSYKGNPVFYRNLMFYFYAMPFVLADEGINYAEVPALEFEGVSYPGIRISYNDGVGISPKDEYFIHYNPSTKKMEWLGYTVTYFSGEKSERISWIRYTEWDTFEGLVLPTELTWQKTEDNLPTGANSARVFENIKISTDYPEDSVFAISSDGEYVEE